MSILKIALMQIAPCGSLDGTLKKGLECCEKAAALGADIAHFSRVCYLISRKSDIIFCAWIEAVIGYVLFPLICGKCELKHC